MNLSTRCLVVLVLLATFWCAGILGAPLLRHAGYQELSSQFYSFYARICHQDDACCFHIGGEKFGVCMRCTAIYFSFLAGVLLYAFTHRRTIMQIPKRWILLAVTLPMVFDVGLNMLGIHASSPATRLCSGALFGVFVPWYVMPVFLDACEHLFHGKQIIHHSPES